MRNQRGITLIALVITIIVLLILAGVSIAMLTGDNGILSNARKSSDETAIANAKERVSTAVNEAMTNYYANVYVEDGGDTMLDRVEAALTKCASEGSVDGATIAYSNKKLTITYDTKLVASGTVDANGSFSWDATPTSGS